MDVQETSSYAVFYSIHDRQEIESVIDDGVETLIVGNDTGPTHFVVLQDTPASLQLGVDAKYSTATLDFIDRPPSPDGKDEPLSLTDIAKRIDLKPIKDKRKAKGKDNAM